MNTVESQVAYDRWHRAQGIETTSDNPWHRQIKSYLRDTNLSISGKKVFEIGCGRGGFSCWLASQTPRAAQVVAADFSLAAVELGKEVGQQLGLQGIQWEQQDIQQIRHPDRSFDWVISCETIEHVPQPRTAIFELARILKPGGLLMLTHPNYFSTFGIYRVSLFLRGRKFEEEGQPINQPLRSLQVQGWLREAGLKRRHFGSRGHYSIWPGRAPCESKVLASPRWLAKWWGFHPLHVAQKSVDA